MIRRVLWTAAVLAGLAVAVALLIYFLSQNTIAYGQKCGGGQCWAYELDQDPFTKRTVLTFSGTWGMRIRHDLPRMQVERANEDRWLANDRAIYLNLRLKSFTDPAAADAHVQILYDFQRGELYLTSPLALWRAPNYQGDPAKNWLTEAEFQKVVARIEP